MPVSGAAPTASMARVGLLLLVASVATGQDVGTVTTLAGGDGATYVGSSDGVGTLATFSGPKGVVINTKGTLALIVCSEADAQTSQIPWLCLSCPA